MLQQQLAKQASVIRGQSKLLPSQVRRTEEKQFRFKDLGVKRYSVRKSSGVWRQNSLAIQLSDAGNGEAQIAVLHNESCGVYSKETL